MCFLNCLSILSISTTTASALRSSYARVRGRVWWACSAQLQLGADLVAELPCRVQGRPRMLLAFRLVIIQQLIVLHVFEILSCSLTIAWPKYFMS